MRLAIVSEAYDPACCGHGGITATLNRLKPFYTWTHGGKTLRTDVDAYISACASCQVNKGSDHRSAGLAQPLLVPDAPWLSISMDFISGLPVTCTTADGSGRYDSVLVIVDRFTKAVHLTPCRKSCTARDVALMVFHSVYRLHEFRLKLCRIGIPASQERSGKTCSAYWALNCACPLRTTRRPMGRRSGQTASLRR